MKKLWRLVAAAIVALTLIPAIAESAIAAERVLYTGAFQDGDGDHEGAGSAEVIKQEDDSLVVRLSDDFASDDGPVLWVMLSPNPDGYGEGAVSLGEIKNLTGPSEYVIPDDVEIVDFMSVIIWCEEFSVLFAVAPLERPDTETTILTADMIGSDADHEEAGTAEIIEVGENARVLRFNDDFSVRKGGHKRVYLSPSSMGLSDGAVDLGNLRRGKGESEYDIPENADLTKFKIVVIFDPEEEVDYAAGALKEPFDPVVVSSGAFQAGEQNYTGSGGAEIVEVAEKSYVVRFLDDFVVSRGPALSVYLSPTNYYDDAAIFLGPLLAETGAQEYRIPPSANIDDFQSVIVWCDEFSVLFTVALLEER
jgi:Electron transfer DM13